MATEARSLPVRWAICSCVILKWWAEAIVGSGLFHGVQIGALKIFDDGHLHRLLVGYVAQDSGHGGLAGHLGGEPAALAGDQLKTIVGERPH